MLSIIITLPLLVSYAFCQFTPPICVNESDILIPPVDMVASVGQTIRLDCTVRFDQLALSFPVWSYQLLNTTKRVELTSDVLRQMRQYTVYAQRGAGTLLYSLNIDVRSSVAGDYFCSLSQSGCPTVTASSTIRVRGRPVIASIPGESTVAVSGEPFLISIRIGGYPVPMVQIFGDINGDGKFEEYMNSHRFSANFISSNSTLIITISEVIPGDAGQYNLFATNSFGTAFRTFSITVLGSRPPAVRSLLVFRSNPVFFLNWTAPPSLENTNITYCVELITSESPLVLQSVCEITETQYTFISILRGLCRPVLFTVYANYLGIRGESSSVTFVTVYRAEILEILRTGSVLMSSPVCSGTALNITDIVQGHTFMASINFNLEKIFFNASKLSENRHYRFTVTAVNAAGQATSTATLSTFDIQNVTIRIEDSVGITIQTEYYNESSARGAFFIFVSLNGAGTPQLDDVNYLVVNRSTSLNFILPFSLNMGRKLILVYDIESNGLLAQGVLHPAVNREFFATKTVLPDAAHHPSSRRLENCRASLVVRIEVECGYPDDSLSTGLQVILHQSDEIEKLYVYHTTRERISLDLLLSKKAQYLVAVFSSREGSGILGSDVEYLQRLMFGEQFTTEVPSPEGTSITIESSVSTSELPTSSSESLTSEAFISRLTEPEATAPSSFGVGQIIGGVVLGSLLVGIIVTLPVYYKVRQLQDRKRTVILEKKVDNVTNELKDTDVKISRSHRFGFGRHTIRTKTLFSLCVGRIFRRSNSFSNESRSNQSNQSNYMIPYDVSSSSL